MSPEEIAAWIRQHHKENPRHGPGCSCMDSMIRQLRLVLAPLLPTDRAWTEADESERTILQSLSYVLTIAQRRR